MSSVVERDRGRAGAPTPLVLLIALLLAGGAGTAGCRVVRVSEAGAEAEESPALRDQIASMLEGAAAAWNRGDLEAFMADYQRSPNTTYIGSAGLVVGWDAIWQRYAPAFAPGAERDSLRFESLRVRSLGQRQALATFRYVLEREGDVTGSGPVTLVLLGVEGQWRIIHDHSSSDPAAADTSSDGSS